MSDHIEELTHCCAYCLQPLAPHPGLGLLIHAETGIRQCGADAADGHVATPWLVIHGFKVTADHPSPVQCSAFSAAVSGTGRHVDWPEWISS